MFSDILLAMRDLVNQYGVHYRIWIGTQLSFTILDPDDIEVNVTDNDEN